jgi:hypothetical protein
MIDADVMLFVVKTRHVVVINFAIDERRQKAYNIWLRIWRKDVYQLPYTKRVFLFQVTQSIVRGIYPQTALTTKTEDLRCQTQEKQLQFKPCTFQAVQLCKFFSKLIYCSSKN